MVAFFFVAAIMLIAALIFVLTPLLRAPRFRRWRCAQARRLLDALNAARDNGILTDAEYAAKRAELGDRLLGALDAPPAQRSRSVMYAALGVALLMPCAAILIYRIVGEPGAVDGTTQMVSDQPPADHSQNMDQAIAKLADKLKQNPQDAEGWTLLGRAYEATEHFEQARDALKHATDLAPNDPDMTIAYAEVLALSTPDRRIEGEPRRLIESAMKTSPDNERGLWLLGISEYQQKKYDAAIALWNRLIGVLPKDSKTIASVKQEIAKAEAARDGKAPPPEEEIADTAPDDAHAAERRRCVRPTPRRQGHDRSEAQRKTRTNRRIVRLRKSRERSSDAAGDPTHDRGQIADDSHAYRWHGHDADDEIVAISTSDRGRTRVEIRQRDRAKRRSASRLQTDGCAHDEFGRTHHRSSRTLNYAVAHRQSV